MAIHQPIANRWNSTQKLVIAAVMIGLGFLLPFLTGQIPEIGKLISPLHIPVLLGGFLLGPLWGLILGIVIPLVRHLIYTMPPMPIAAFMACEMGVYGLTAGSLNAIFTRRDTSDLGRIYGSLVPAIILGRCAYGLVFWIFQNREYTFGAFLTGMFVEKWLAILIQLILIPVVVIAVERSVKKI